MEENCNNILKNQLFEHGNVNNALRGHMITNGYSKSGFKMARNYGTFRGHSNLDSGKAK